MWTCQLRWRKVAAGALAAIGLSGAALVALTELAYRRQGAGPDVPPTGRGAVVVLGVPGTNPLLRVAQRWRVDLALAAVATGRIDRVVFTGGPVRSERSEASEMADIAVARGLDPSLVVLDERSRSTWENVAEAARLVGPVDFVVLASDAFHAARARVYWWDQNGADASPLFVLADRYRRFDHLALRAPATVVELVHRLRRRGWLSWPDRYQS